MTRALNLDANEVAVTVGGRGFVLKQQAKAPLMRVLNAIFNSDNEELEAAKEGESEASLSENVAETFMKEWDKALPIFAMMFGFDPKQEDTWTEALQFLEEHLAPMAGVKVFHAWWGLNEIDSFFMRCGRTLVHPSMEREIEAEVRRRTQEAAEEIVDSAVVAQATAE